MVLELAFLRLPIRLNVLLFKALLARQAFTPCALFLLLGLREGAAPLHRCRGLHEIFEMVLKLTLLFVGGRGVEPTLDVALSYWFQGNLFEEGSTRRGWARAPLVFTACPVLVVAELELGLGALGPLPLQQRLDVVLQLRSVHLLKSDTS